MRLLRGQERMKIALYARVSKADDQHPENQLLELRRWAVASGYEVAGEFVDEISSRDMRPKKEEVLRKLRVGEIQGVVFVALDRWGRNMGELASDMEEAVTRNWLMISLKEGLRLDTAAGRLYGHLLGAFANFERDRIKERTIAGLARVRAQGKRLGRRPASFDLELAKRLRSEGWSYPKIADRVGTSMPVIYRALKGTLSKTPPENPSNLVEGSGPLV